MNEIPRVVFDTNILFSVTIALGQTGLVQRTVKKVRDAQIRLVPYMLVIGGREMEEGSVSIRDRIDGDIGSLPIATTTTNSTPG